MFLPLGKDRNGTPCPPSLTNRVVQSEREGVPQPVPQPVTRGDARPVQGQGVGEKSAQEEGGLALAVAGG